MKKIGFLLAVFFVIIGYLWIHRPQESSQSPVHAPKPTQETQVLGNESSQIRALFIPYWTVGSEKLDTQNFNELIYFGVAANTKGLDQTDPGYAKVSDFMSITDSSKKRLLTVRMLDQDVNSDVLSDSAAQKKIISQSIDLASDNHFDGIVLDFETASVSFDSIVSKITSFNNSFAVAAHQKKLTYNITVYGDAYYRVRPFDIKTLGAQADQVLIMAYDFHKARGNPGPNFPLSGKATYGYDFKTMISDFSKDMPKEKIVPVFGLFGYDWELDKQDGIPTSSGVSSSMNTIKAHFIDSCTQSECKWVRDQESGETKVTYKYTDGKYHEIWFEDASSVATKRAYLKQQGINSYGYWAYSYF